MPLKHTVEEIELKNGAKGLLINIPGSTAVHYSVHFRAGYQYVDDQRASQAAHLMEHMSVGANEKYRTIEDFSREFLRNGAYINARTDQTNMIYVADAAAMEADRILDLQGLSITRPLYLQEVLDTEKGNVEDELVRYSNNPSRVIYQHSIRSVGLPIILDSEKIESLQHVNLGHITDHFRKTHTLGNMRFVFAGDFDDRSEVIDKLESWDLPSGERLPVEPKEAVCAPDMIHIKRVDYSNLTFNLSFFLNRKLTLPEISVMSVLTHILVRAKHSRILGAARQKGICYSIGSSFGNMDTGNSSLSIGTQVGFGNVEELFTLITEQLLDVASNGVTQEELDGAKSYNYGSMQLNMSTVSSMANWYRDSYCSDDEIDFIDGSIESVNAVSSDDVRSLAKEFVEGGIWSFAGLGNIEEAELREHYEIFLKAFSKRS